MVWNVNKKPIEFLKPQIKYELVEITPEWAADLLKLNTKNRKMQDNSVSQYARDMLNGNFVFNGNTICLSDTNVLLDGQQRLTACVKSNSPFWTILIAGLPESSMVTIDSGRKRTYSNQLQIRGYPNHSLLASTIAQLGLIALGKPRNLSQFTISELDQIFDNHPQVADSASFVKGTYHHNPLLAAIHYIAKFSGYEDLADDFIKTWKDGQQNYEDDPIVFIREKLNKDQTRIKRMTTEHKCKLIMLSWNKFCKAEPLKSAKISIHGYKMQGWDIKKCGVNKNHPTIK